MMKKIFFIGLVALSALALAGRDDVQVANQQQSEYCEMVSLYKNTGGEYGWPDFRGNFQQVCNG